MTLQERIEVEIGAGDDAVLLGQLLEQSVLDIWGGLSAEALMDLATKRQAASASTAVDVSDGRVLRVVVRSTSGGSSRLAVAAEPATASDSYVYTDRPRYYVEGGELYVLPKGGDVYVAVFPALTLAMDEAASGLPRLMLPLVARRTAVLALHDRMRRLREELPAELQAAAALSVPLDFTEYLTYYEEEDEPIMAVALQKQRLIMEKALAEYRAAHETSQETYRVNLERWQMLGRSIQMLAYDLARLEQRLKTSLEAYLRAHVRRTEIRPKFYDF